LPEAVPGGSIGRPFVDNAGSPVRKRTVNNIGMPGHPSNICSAPENIVLLEVENQLAGRIYPDQVTRRSMLDALGFSRRAGGIEYEQRILRIHLLRRALKGSLIHDIVPPNVPSGFHVDLLVIRANSLEYDRFFYSRRIFQRFIGDLLEGNHTAPPPPS